MSQVRKSTVEEISHEELFALVKTSLDEVELSYEEKPGGFGPGPMLDPSIWR